MAAKNIQFRLKIKGYGIVNFDSSRQRFMYFGTNLSQRMGSTNDNILYSKKRFSGDAKDLKCKIIISKDCLRHAIFIKDFPYQSPNVMNTPNLFYSNIASPGTLLRGTMFAEQRKEDCLKRKSPLTIIDAEQTCNAISHIEICSRSGKKNRDIEVVDNTFFEKEVVGHMEYETEGFLDLMELQFVCADQIHERMSFNPDMFDLYSKFMSKRMPNFNSKLGYYQMRESMQEIPEYGFKLSQENIVFLTKELFKRILDLSINKSGSFAKTSEFQYKIIYEPANDTAENESGWIKIESKNDINKIDFITEDLYVLVDPNESKKQRDAIDADIEIRKAENKAVKEEKKAFIKAKKAAKKTENVNSDNIEIKLIENKSTESNPVDNNG